jgi:ankyrin repeat protein
MTRTDELFDAITQGDTIVIEKLIGEDPSLLATPREGVTPLRMAVYAGHAELAAELERQGADPDVFDVAALGDVDRLRKLLDDDPTLTATFAGDGFTALHLAAFFGHDKAAELLLARGADPEAVARNGTDLRPLHSAAAGGHLVIAHLLLDRGADIDARQQGGYTPLHSAVNRNDAELVAMLLGRGADPAAVTDDGRLPADLATDPDVRALFPA